jgi:hypothetical protein
VEARRQASYCICPSRGMIVRRPRLLTCRAGVGVVNVPTMCATVVPILKPLERGGWL